MVASCPNERSYFALMTDGVHLQEDQTGSKPRFVQTFWPEEAGAKLFWLVEMIQLVC